LFDGQEEKLKDKLRRKNYSAALSGALTNLVNKKLLYRIAIPGIRGYYYALPEWLNNSKEGLKAKYSKRLDETLLDEVF